MNCEEFKKDWRNMGQLDYLTKAKLKRVKYSFLIGDHEHCEFCSEKISPYPNTLHYGYYSINTKYKYWVCDKCFEDFKELFQWNLV